MLVGERPLLQFFAFAAVLGALAYLGFNLTANMARVGLRPGFGFLWRPANFAIGESLIAYSPEDSFARALLVGVTNTLFVSALGCVLATLLGVGIALARISTNRLLAGLARGYVEAIRNTPLLLQLFFWIATFEALPGPRQALAPIPGVMLTNRGVFFPALHAGAGGATAALGLAALIAIGFLAAPRIPARLRRLRGLAALTPVVVALLAALIAAESGAIGVELPLRHGFNIEGGVVISPEFAALLVGLAINSAAGIAEIVRGGIASVPRGQWDAARALGLSTSTTLRHVIMPQVVRVILPVMTSSYLSLTKNSSLAVAIGYPDLVSIANTEANQSGQALEAIMIMAGAYLAISLAVSVVINTYNARISARVR